ncbi:MAG: ATP synthase F0 sector subunit a, partial [uncultured Solirubrobacteraceae bacterium]
EHTPQSPLRHPRGLRRLDGPRRPHLRRHPPRQRGLRAAERVQARRVVRARPDRVQQGRVLRDRRGPADHRDDALHREPDAGAPEPGPDRGGDALLADARQHHPGQHGRPDGGEVVPVHRRAVPVHLVLEPDRLHPAADEHGAPDRRVRGLDPLLRDLRRDGERLHPAGPRARGLHRLQPRGHPRQGRRRLPQEPGTAGREGADGRLHLRPGVHLELHAADLALRPPLREHPRGPSDHPLHVRRPGGPARDRGPRRLHPPVRRPALHVRGGPRRHAAGLHLRHLVCHLPRRRGRRPPL